MSDRGCRSWRRRRSADAHRARIDDRDIQRSAARAGAQVTVGAGMSGTGERRRRARDRGRIDVHRPAVGEADRDRIGLLIGTRCLGRGRSRRAAGRRMSADIERAIVDDGRRAGSADVLAEPDRERVSFREARRRDGDGVGRCRGGAGVAEEGRDRGSVNLLVHHRVGCRISGRERRSAGVGTCR